MVDSWATMARFPIVLNVYDMVGYSSFFFLNSITNNFF